MRIFTVTGTGPRPCARDASADAATASRTIARNSPRFHGSALPPPLRVTFGTGQPKFRSTWSARSSATSRCTAAATVAGIDAVELHAARRLVGVGRDHRHRLVVALDERPRRDHLGDVDAGGRAVGGRAGVLAGEAAERAVGDARHRREHDGDAAAREELVAGMGHPPILPHAGTARDDAEPSWSRPLRLPYRHLPPTADWAGDHGAARPRPPRARGRRPRGRRGRPARRPRDRRPARWASSAVGHGEPHRAARLLLPRAGRRHRIPTSLPRARSAPGSPTWRHDAPAGAGRCARATSPRPRTGSVSTSCPGRASRLAASS